MEEKKKIIIIFNLSVFIFITGINYAFAQLQTWRGIEKLEAQAKSPEQAPEIIVRPDIEYASENLRDPFRGFIEERVTAVKEEEKAEIPLPSLNVQGIIWGGKFPQAIINHRVVKVEDTIEGARIIDINKDGVTVFFNNRKYNLSSPAAVGLENLEKKPKGGKEYEEKF